MWRWLHPSQLRLSYRSRQLGMTRPGMHILPLPGWRGPLHDRRVDAAGRRAPPIQARLFRARTRMSSACTGTRSRVPWPTTATWTVWHGCPARSCHAATVRSSRAHAWTMACTGQPEASIVLTRIRSSDGVRSPSHRFPRLALHVSMHRARCRMRSCTVIVPCLVQNTSPWGTSAGTGPSALCVCRRDRLPMDAGFFSSPFFFTGSYGSTTLCRSCFYTTFACFATVRLRCGGLEHIAERSVLHEEGRCLRCKQIQITWQQRKRRHTLERRNKARENVGVYGTE